MPSIKGTASVADDHAMNKMLKSTKFPACFSTRANIDKINIPVLSQWIEQRIAAILGFDDEIVQSTAINLFLPTALPDSPPPDVDPRRAQIDLAGFLGQEEAATFAEELWTLMLDAQSSPMGVPKKLLEEKKQEIERQKAAVAAAAAPPHKRGGPGMNRFVVEARQRAEAARQALATGPNVPPARAVAANNRSPFPVPVSPSHPSEEPAEEEGLKRRGVRNESGPYKSEEKSFRGRRGDDERPRNYRDDESYDRRRRTRSPGTDSASSRGSDTSGRGSRGREDERRRRRTRDESSNSRRRDRDRRRYRYDSEENEEERRRRRDVHRRRSRDRDHRGRRDRDDRSNRDEHRHRRERDDERSRYRSRMRSRSYDREDGKRRHRRRRIRSRSAGRSNRSDSESS